MISTATRATSCLPSLGTPSGSASSVREDLLGSLRSHGLRSPLRGLGDPRLAYPEMLLMSGWERVETDKGFAYQMVAEDSEPQQYFAQSLEFSHDGQCSLETYAGRMAQTITALSDGRIRSQIRQL